MKTKNRFLTLCLSAVMLVSAFAFSACKDETSSDPTPTPSVDTPYRTITSPDGDINLDVYFKNGQISYSVEKGDVTVVEKSNIGFATDECEFVDLSFVSEKKESKTISYTNVSGKKKEVTTSFNENILTFSEGDFVLEVVFRAYNDGYAFRYNIRKSDGTDGEFTVADELTHFALPDNAKTYAMEVVLNQTGVLGSGEYYSYEEKYQYRSYKNLESEKLGFPVLYSVKSGDNEVYSLITESDIYGHDYHGSALQKDGSEGLKTIHMPACGTDASMEASYPFTSPWRLAIVGGLDTITESTLVEDVYDEIEPWKPDNYDSLSDEEKQIYTYDWVNPGVAAWSYLNYGSDAEKQAAQSDYELQRKYVDAISNLGWTWLVLDAGWDTGSFTEAKFTEFVEYANSKNVHIMVWADSFNSFYTRTQTDAKLAQWQEWGIEGVKIDFFDGQGAPYMSSKWKLESQQSLDDHYEMFYQEAAKYKMLVDCHGCNKPTGERRQYPNVINREAIRGNEFTNVDAKQTAYLPFTRGTIGPSDFTPAIIPYQSGTTVAHNMGLAVTLESGMPTFSDVPEHFTSGQYLDFYRNLPVVWDDTKFVGADIGNYAVIARRSGNKWYVGCTASYAGDIEVDLSFLTEGNHTVCLWEDTDGYNAIKMSSKTVTNSTKLTITVKDGGGFAMIIE